MKKLLELGNHYVSDFIKDDSEMEGRQKYSLDLYLDEELGAPRLNPADIAPPSTMWGRYWYRSAINTSMTLELQGIVKEITSRVKLKDNDVWLDIACNDGTLLKAVPDNLKKVGIDPCDDSFYAESSKVATVVQDYFSKDAWIEAGFSGKKAKVITCIAMFYDLDDPHPFVQDMYDVLDDDGVAVLQMSYTPLMINQLAFDNICHEHVYYYDLKSINKLFSQHGFKVVDCSLNDTNGGSFRIYFQKESAPVSSFGSSPLRDVCDYRVETILNYENNVVDISSPIIWNSFKHRLDDLKIDVLEFIEKAKHSGKSVYGYGASTKGNTLLQYFGIDNTHVKAIAERSPYKFGYKTIGSNIPIISEEEMRKAKPDYALVLPWHFISEFQVREKAFLDGGGAFIVPCPIFEIISK
jgi:ubiquinone/menaquinone biosynthesis C-methylase UbiE